MSIIAPPTPNEFPFLVQKSITLNANNTSVNVPVFRISGSVYIYALFGVVTTALSSSITSASFRLYDQTTATNITTGVTLSSFAINSLVLCRNNNASALGAANASTNPPSIGSTTVDGPWVGWQFGAVQKPSVNTDIEFNYTTTNTPASGVINFHVWYKPYSYNVTGSIAAV